MTSSTPEIKAGAVRVPTSLAPWLSVPDCRKAAEFYQAAFGAKVVYRMEDPGGGMVLRLAVDGAEFWVSGESNGHEQPQMTDLGGGSLKMILTVADPDARFAAALAAGAVEVYPVGEGHGWRLGRLVDPFGLHWEIGHPLGPEIEMSAGTKNH